jgi:hypothetical protein
MRTRQIDSGSLPVIIRTFLVRTGQAGNRHS